MATLNDASKKKVTRVKRDYPEFRLRLRSLLAEKELTQGKAAELVDMDARTFNHVIAGPTHPDLQLLKDIGEKFSFNLNYLFGLSNRKDNVPDAYNFNGMKSLPIHEHIEGSEWFTKRKQIRYMLLPEGPIQGRQNPMGFIIKDSQCDALMGATNILVTCEDTKSYSKKGVYLIKVNNCEYFRWVERRLGGTKYKISSDTLGNDSVEMSEDEFEIGGMVVRRASDF